MLNCQLHAVPGTGDSLMIVTFAFVALRLTLALIFSGTYVARHSPAVRHSSLIPETRRECEDNSRGICDACNGAGDGLPLGTYVLPCLSSSEYVTRLQSSTVLEDITIGILSHSSKTCLLVTLFKLGKFVHTHQIQVLQIS